MDTLLQDRDLVETAPDFAALAAAYEPSEADWEDYRRHLGREEAVEMLDRTGAMERIRRADFDSARSAACRVRGIAAALGAHGFDGIGRQLLAAADDIQRVIARYA